MASKKAASRTGLASNPFAALTDLRPSLPDATVPRASHAELEAVIERDPEDPQGYLVYGDVLQTAGDPRGALIALHHAAMTATKPKDRAAKREVANRFIEEHRHYLLGAFVGTSADLRSTGGEEEIAFDWFLGFIRHAKVSAASIDRVIELVSMVVALPSARFLRELEIVMMTTSATGVRSRAHAPITEASAMRIVECLGQLGRPKTLRRLQLPVLGGFVPSSSLYQAFPLLKRDPASAWGEALERADKPARRLRPIVMGADPLPRLEPKSGVAIASDGIDHPQLVRALKAEVDKAHALGVVEAMTDAFTKQSLDAFVLALARDIGGLRTRAPNPNPNLLVEDNDDEDEDGEEEDADDSAAEPLVEPAREPWAFDLMGPLGGDRCIEALYPTLARLTHGRSLHALRVLRRIGSGVAICAMYSLARTPRRVLARRRVAREHLASLAEERELTLEQLVDRACANPGYRTLLETATLYEEAPAVVDARRLWMTERMLSGHPWGVDEFGAVIASRARDVMAFRALVFRHHEGSSDQFFRLERDGSPLDVNDVPHELTKGRVSIAHPLELADQDLLDSWSADILRRSRIRQPIFQLLRPIFRLTDEEKNSTELASRFRDRSRTYETLAPRLLRADWESVGMPEHDELLSSSSGDASGDLAFWFSKRFPRSGHTIAVRLTDATLSVMIDHRSKPKLGVLDPVDASEMLYELDLATS